MGKDTGHVYRSYQSQTEGNDLSTKYQYSPLVDGFSKKFDLQQERRLIRCFEKDILAEIKKRKDQKLSVSQYIANFSPAEKRCFLGLLKHFKQVKIMYCYESGISCQYLIGV